MACNQSIDTVLDGIARCAASRHDPSTDQFIFFGSKFHSPAYVGVEGNPCDVKRLRCNAQPRSPYSVSSFSASQTLISD
jgi:hypothetical protein